MRVMRKENIEETEEGCTNEQRDKLKRERREIRRREERAVRRNAERRDGPPEKGVGREGRDEIDERE